MQFQKYPYCPHMMDWNFWEVGAVEEGRGGGVVDSERPKNLKRCMKLNQIFYNVIPFSLADTCTCMDIF